MALTAHQPRTSEGTHSAQRIAGLNFPDLDPCYLDEQIDKHRAPPPLRLIKRPEPPQGRLVREGKRPPAPQAAPTYPDHRARRITWLLLTAWCVMWLGGALWFALV